MTWDYGTITSSTPATQLTTKIGEAMVNSGYYQQVDDHTISSYRYRVWQNSTKGFYVVLRHLTAGTGTVDGGLCEQYNSTTHIASYPARTIGIVQADYGLGKAISYGSGGYALNDFDYNYLNTNSNTTGFTYQVSASEKRVAYATLYGTTTSGIAYIGTYEPLVGKIVGAGPTAWSGSDPGAYICGGPSTSVNQFTRSLTPTRINQAVNVNVGVASFNNVSGTPGNYNSFWEGIVVTRYYFNHYYDNTLPRGLLYGIVGFSSSSTYVFGDELTVNGVAKYKIASSTSAIEMI